MISLLSALANGEVIVIAADSESVRTLMRALAAKPELMLVEPPKRFEKDVEIELAFTPGPPPVNIPLPKKAGQSGAFYESLLRHKNKW